MASYIGITPSAYDSGDGHRTETGDPIGKILARLLKRNPSPELAHQLRESLPPESVPLLEVSVETAKQCLDALSEQDRRILPLVRSWSPDLETNRNVYRGAVGAVGPETPTPGCRPGRTIVARQAHNLKVAGSNPAPATKYFKGLAVSS